MAKRKISWHLAGHYRLSADAAPLLLNELRQLGAEQAKGCDPEPKRKVTRSLLSLLAKALGGPMALRKALRDEGEDDFAQKLQASRRAREVKTFYGLSNATWLFD